MNADYCDAILEGVRCIMQVLNVTADRRDFWRVAITPRSKAEGGGTLWRYPDTWKMEDDRGYWKRSIIPQLENAYKGSHLASDVSKYMSDRRDVGNIQDSTANNRRRATGNQMADGTKRLYPAGPALSKA